MNELHILSCYLMTGIIWLVQLVHYPSFAFIEKEQFTNFERFHSSQITFLVAPLMLIELATISIINLRSSSSENILLLVITLFIWTVTFLISIPCHKKLTHAFSKETLDWLIKSNWFRTAAWSLKSIVILIEMNHE